MDIVYFVYFVFVRVFVYIVVERVREFGVKNVVLSGGVVYNEFIIKMIRKVVEVNGLNFYVMIEVLRGDNGVNVG